MARMPSSNSKGNEDQYSNKPPRNSQAQFNVGIVQSSPFQNQKKKSIQSFDPHDPRIITENAQKTEDYHLIKALQNENASLKDENKSIRARMK